MYFHYFVPLEKNVILRFNRIESSSPKDAFCHFVKGLVEIGQVV